MDLFSHNHSKYFLRKKGITFNEKNTLPSMGVNLLYFGVMWQLNIAWGDGKMDPSKV